MPIAYGSLTGPSLEKAKGPAKQQAQWVQSNTHQYE